MVGLPTPVEAQTHWPSSHAEEETLRLRSLATVLFMCISIRDVSATDQGIGDRIEPVVKQALGASVQVLSSNAPHYLLGDFNGDGNQDVAVQVQAEKHREELRARRVRYLDINPFSQRNGSELNPVADMGRNCVGIVVLHGSSPAWNARFTGQPYFFDECFSPFRIVRRGERILHEPGATGQAPVPRGDAIQLDLESGGQTLVYWDGKTYRGFGQRDGD